MDDSMMMRAALAASKIALESGHHAQGLLEAELALELARRIADDGGLAQANAVLAHHRFALGQFEAAVAHGAQALQRTAEPQARCDLLCRVAAALGELDLADEAIDCARNALETARKHGLGSSVAQALTMLGAQFGRQHEHDQAEAMLLQALSLGRELHDPEAVASTINPLLAVLGDALEAQRRAGDAARTAAIRARLLAQARDALAWCQQETHNFRRTVMRSNVAHALMLAGFLDDALDLLQAAQKQAAAEGYTVMTLTIHSRIAQCRLLQGDLAAARAGFEDILGSEHSEDLALARSDTLRRLAELLRRQGLTEALAPLLAQERALRQQHQTRTDAARHKLQRELQRVHRTLEVVDTVWAQTRPGTF